MFADLVVIIKKPIKVSKCWFNAGEGADSILVVA